MSLKNDGLELALDDDQRRKLAEACVREIKVDIESRIGLRDDWKLIAPEQQEEILKNWEFIIGVFVRSRLEAAQRKRAKIQSGGQCVGSQT